MILRPKSEVRKRDANVAFEFESKEKTQGVTKIAVELEDFAEFDEDQIIEVDAAEEGEEFMVESRPCPSSTSPTF